MNMMHPIQRKLGEHMNDKIVPLKRPETEEDTRLVLTCSECECITHYVHDDQTIECANCGEPMSAAMEWRLDTPPKPETPKDTNGCVKVTNLGSPEAARAAVISNIRKWSQDDEIIMIVGVHTSGSTRDYTRIKSEEDRQDIIEQIEGLLNHVKKAKIVSE